MPCSVACVSAEARRLREELDHSSVLPLRTLVVVDAPKHARNWTSAVNSSLEAIRRAESAHRLVVNPILPHSCFGLQVLERALNVSAQVAPQLFKNTLAYVWGVLRAAQMSPIALHVDTDWSVRAAGLQSRHWLSKATALLTQHPTVAAVVLEHCNLSAPSTHARAKKLATAYEAAQCSNCSTCFRGEPKESARRAMLLRARLHATAVAQTTRKSAPTAARASGTRALRTSHCKGLCSSCRG